MVEGPDLLKPDVLIKGGDLLEIPAGLATVAMDKTGTLTEGSFADVNVIDFEALGMPDSARAVSVVAPPIFRWPSASSI